MRRERPAGEHRKVRSERACLLSHPPPVESAAVHADVELALGRPVLAELLDAGAWCQEFWVWGL